MIFSWLILRNIFHVCYCATFTVILLFQQNRRCMTTQPEVRGHTSFVLRYDHGPLVQGSATLFLLRTGLKLKIIRGPAFKKPH